MKKLLLISSIMAGAASLSATQTLFVDAASTVSNPTGTSWQSPFASIADAVTASYSGDTILIKYGTYKEMVMIPQELHIYGGFNGTESFAAQGNPSVYTTTLDGDVSGDDITLNPNNRTDDLPYLFFIYDENGNGVNTTVDGITFTHAYNNNGANSGSGSALIVKNYFSGGPNIYTTGSTITRCKFLDNWALSGGAAFIGSTGNNNVVYALFDKCVFINNTAMTGRGGAAFVYGYGGAQSLGAGQFTNCVFHGNVDPSTDVKSVIYGGASSSTGIAQVVLVNNTFFNNAAAAALVTNGSAVNGTIAMLTMKNNIVWNNETTTPCVSVGLPSLGSNNYQALFANNCTDGAFANYASSNVSYSAATHYSFNPQMVDPFNMNYTLQSASQCINSGDTAQVSAAYLDNYDLGHSNRFSGAAVDLGAFEYYFPASVAEYHAADAISVFPNPATAHVMLQLNEKSLVEIYTADGKLVSSSEMQAGMNTLDISEYESGIYILKAGSSVTKFIKQ